MLDEEAREDLIERITAIFTNEANAAEFNEDPDAYVDENLPEGTEAADIQGCLPEVAERTGLDFSNVASTGGGATAAGQLSHTYQTIYQQNSYIYAEEGSQVTNIQGDGNAVAQQDVDVDIDYGSGDEDTEEPPTDPTETPDPMDPEGETPEPPVDGLPEPEPEPEPLPEPEPEPAPEPPPEPEPEPEPAPPEPEPDLPA